MSIPTNYLQPAATLTAALIARCPPDQEVTVMHIVEMVKEIADALASQDVQARKAAAGPLKA